MIETVIEVKVDLSSLMRWDKLREVERIISSKINVCYPRDWDEDFITRTWLSALIASGPKLLFPSGKVQVAWDAYKMTKSSETKYGDVAFVVKVSFQANKDLTGVGFLEAKRIYSNGKFNSLCWRQLGRMLRNARQHHLLLYDYQPQSNLQRGFGNFFCCDELYFDGGSPATVLPSRHALTIRSKDRSLETFAYPLSKQIVLRYFRGLDLNFNPKMVEEVLSGIPGGVKFLIVAHALLSDEAGEASLESIQPRGDSGFIRLEE